MRVDRLVVTGFRSYDELVIDPPPGPQILYGANAAGKTNLVESLVVLARGASHRAADTELVAWSGELARLEAAVDHGPGHGPDLVEVVIPRPAAGTAARKRIRINGVPRRAPALGQALQVVLFAPEEMLLVVGSPSLRRAALDGLAAARSPGHGRALATYGRALAQRNSLLRAIREGTAGRDQLPYWDGLLVDEGGAIVAGRLAALADLEEPLAAAHAEIAPGEGRLAMGYVTNAPAEASESPADAIRRRLAETADKELWNGATLVGPHRDDIVFRLDDRPLAGVRVARPAAHGDPGPQAGRGPPADLTRRGAAAAPARRRVQRAGPAASSAPGAAHPGPAPGLHHHHRAGRPRPRARGGLDRVARDARSRRTERRVTNRRRPMRRLGDLLPPAAQALGLEEPLMRGRAMAAWSRLVAERVPAAAGTSTLLDLRDDGTIVAAAPSPIVAQELTLRADELLAAFAQAPGGRHMRELRVVVRPPRSAGPARVD